MEPQFQQCNASVQLWASLWSFHILSRPLSPFTAFAVFEKFLTSGCRLLATNHDDCKDDTGQVAEQSQDDAHNDLPSTAQIPIHTKGRDEVRTNARDTVISAHSLEDLTAVQQR